MGNLDKGNMRMIFLLIIIVITSSLVFAYPQNRQGMSTMDNAASLGWNMGEGMAGQSWENKADDYAASMGYTNKNASYGNYKGTPVPLSSGNMFFFANNQFKPECCPSSYSTGSGCACMSKDQVNYLNERGGNRTIAPSEY